MATRLNIPELVSDWEQVVAQLPEYPKSSFRNLVLDTSEYEVGEVTRFYDPAVGRLEYAEHPTSVTYPILREQRVDGRWTTWMSADQPEVSAMAAHASAARGDILVAGLGLGILPWLAAKNPSVQSITVIEIRPEVISLIWPIVENDKTTVIQGDLWAHINEKSETYDFIDIDVWAELGRAVMECEEAKEIAAPALKPGGIVRTWMDEMASRWLTDGVGERICREMAYDNGRLFIRPAIQRDYPCEFCGTVNYLDCYRLCLECCVALEMPYRVSGRAGRMVRKRFQDFMERAIRGGFNRLMEQK